MTLEKTYNEHPDEVDWSIYCDQPGCHEDAEYESESFQGAWAQAKEDGWRVFKEDGEWVYSCPECVEEWKREQRR